MEDLAYLIKGNGKPGLMEDFRNHRTEVVQFMKSWAQREEDKMVYDDRAEKRSKSIRNRITIVALLATLILGILTFLGFSRAPNRSFLQHSDLDSTYAAMNQPWR